MNPISNRRIRIRKMPALAAVIFTLVISQVAYGQAAPAVSGTVPQAVAASSDGDTLDTSTPAPKGMESPTSSTVSQSASGDSLSAVKPDSLASVADDAPSEGGFIIPLEGDVFYERNVRVLAMLPGTPPASLSLLVDGLPETGALTIHDEMVSVELKGLKGGAHQLALLLFNERTEIIGRMESRFFVRIPEPKRTTHANEFKQFGRVVAKVDWKNGEAKGRILSQSELKLAGAGKDSLVAGSAETPISQELEGVTEAAYNVKYKQLQAYGKILLRTDEDKFRQPAHRLTASIKYGPWAALKAGDIYPLYNPLVLNGTRVRGGEAAANLVLGETQWGSFRVVRGESRREVPAYIVKYDTGNGTRTDTVPGTFSQTLTAARLGFGGGPVFDLGITLLKASDDTGSPEMSSLNNRLRGLRPADNLVPGLDLRIGLWDGRIQIYGNGAMSLYTRDKSLGAFSADTFDVAFNPKKYEDFFIINSSTKGWQYLLSQKSINQSPDVAGFLNSNSAYEGGVVSSVPFSGIIAETEIRYSHLGLEYHSEGNPFLGGNPGDGFTALEKLTVMENKLSLGLEFGNYGQDLGVTSQTQRNLKVELRYTPGPYQPSFWIGGSESNIQPDGRYAHQFRSRFANFNTGGYHQFQLPDGKLYTTLLYGYTQSDFSLTGTDTASVPDFPTTRTNIVNAMLQYKMRSLDFLPRVAYTFSHNGIQRPTHTVTMGFLQPFLENTVKLDLAATVGQYPLSNTQNDLSLGAGANVEYVLGPQQTFNLREKWIRYGSRQNLLVGANYELFF